MSSGPTHEHAEQGGAAVMQQSRRTTVALRSDRALMHTGFAAVCERYAPWLTLSTGDDGRVDVMVFDPSGHHERDASDLDVLRQQRNIRTLAILVDPVRERDEDGDRMLRATDVAIGTDVTDEQLVRALLGAASRKHRRVVPRRTDAEWFGKAAGLTRRQGQCVALCATGLTNQEIAAELFVNIETVKSHLKRAFRVLGVRSRAELIALVLRANA